MCCGQQGTLSHMRRIRTQGWGEWSDVVVVALDDPKWEKQQKREAEQQATASRFVPVITPVTGAEERSMLWGSSWV